MLVLSESMWNYVYFWKFLENLKFLLHYTFKFLISAASNIKVVDLQEIGRGGGDRIYLNSANYLKLYKLSIWINLN